MKILTAEQLRAVDAYTIEQEPVASIDLMERAAARFTEAILVLSAQGAVPLLSESKVLVLCGMGNNGGDGLAVARMLAAEGVSVRVLVVKHISKGSPDFQSNLERLASSGIEVALFEEGIPVFEADLVIDALFGSGLNKPIEGWLADVVNALNAMNAAIVSIDMPSGLFCDDNKDNNPEYIVRADFTLTFEVPKLSLLFAEHFPFVGEWRVLPIGLDQDFIGQLPTDVFLVDPEMIAGLIQHRPRVAHKGHFGHALIMAGSKGKMGAAILALKACVHSGAGLTTGHVPECGLVPAQISVPEAMCSVDEAMDFISQVPELDGFSAIGVGPGLSQDPQTANALKLLIQNARVPLVLDADALNILAENPAWQAFLPKGSILTPHPKEFERLAGKYSNDHDRLDAARELARKLGVVLVLKGAYTAICSPEGKAFFNNTGNAGMATGGSGDVLTGVITGLLAQGYNSTNAAILGVYWHGLAGDEAAKSYGQPAMAAGDIVQHLGKAWKRMLS